MQTLYRRNVLRSVALYGVAAVLWLAVSHSLLASFPNPATLETYWDISFIAGTAVLLLYTLRNKLGKSDPSQGQESLAHIVIDNAPDYVFIKDTASRYILANKAYMALIGVTQLDQIVGKTDYDLFPRILATGFVKSDQLILRTGEPSIDVEATTLDPSGKSLSITVTKVPLRDTRGKITGILGIIHDVTERKQATEALAQAHDELESRVAERTADLARTNAALQKSEALYRTLAKHFPNGAVFLYDSELRYMLVEGSELPIFGISKELLEGKTLFEIFPELADFLEPAYRSALNGTPSYHDVPYAGRTFAAYVVPVKNEQGEVYAGMVMTQDITEHKQTEAALRESEQRFRMLSEATFEGIFIHDQGVIVDVNSALAEMMSYQPEELIGRTTAEFVKDEFRDAVRANAQTGFSATIELVVIRKDGTTFQAEIRSRSVFYRGHDMRIVAVRDITDRKRIEEILRNSSVELERQVEARTAALSDVNTRLHQEIAERARVEDAEHKQRVLAEALCDTAAALNSTLNFEEVLERILANANHVVKHDRGNIMLIEDGFTRTVRTRGYDDAAVQDTVLNAHWPVATTSTFQWMIEHKRALVVPDSKKFAGWKRSDGAELVQIDSYLGVPILQADEVIGFLNLDCKYAGYFKPDDANRLQSFADQIAIAVGNAHQYEQAQVLAAMQERQRLARDLHDAVIQTLFSASIIAEALPRMLKEHPEKLERGLVQLHQLVRGALAEMRTLLLELRPTALLSTRLGELMRQLAEATKGRTGIQVVTSIDDQRALPPDVQMGLYRIAQEVLNNIVRHAHANRISIRLINNLDVTELSISDDGQGFDPAQIPANHFGIGIMNERAETIGAAFTIDSRIGAGTQVKVVWSDTDR